MVTIDINGENIGIAGMSGQGKSYLLEHEFFKRIKRSVLLIDPKNQYPKGIPGIKNFHIIERKTSRETDKLENILMKIKIDFLIKKYRWCIHYVPADETYDPEQRYSINYIIERVMDLGRVHLILEESHEFMENHMRAIRQVDRTFRRRCFHHNKDDLVTWLSQFPDDMSRSVMGQTQKFLVFYIKPQFVKRLKERQILGDQDIVPEKDSYKYIVVDL